MKTEDLVAAGARPERADALVAAAEGETDPLVRWRRLTEALRPEDPMAVHETAHAACFVDWKVDLLGPAPITVPSADDLAASNLGRTLRARGFGVDVSEFHRHSVRDPEHHYREQLERIGVVYETPPQRVLEGEGAEAEWLPGAVLNIAETALHGDDARLAVIVGREGTDTLRRVSLGTLRSDAMRVAHGLERRGLAPGDAVAIDMPMTYEAVVIYLGIVAFGGAVVSIADSFAATEIATRLRISAAKAIFTQDVILRGGKHLPLFARVAEADAPPAIVIGAEGDTLAVPLREGDVAYADFVAELPDTPRFHRVPAGTTSNILFSSGTTGDPKAIPWTHVTPLKSATDAWGHQDVREGDVVAWPTNLGWMMGPWLIYASLLNRAAIALYEGLPHQGGFGDFVAAARVTMLGLVPSLVSAWRKTGALDGRDLSALRAFSSTGEASRPADMHWLASRAGYRPVIEYCGGTEIGGGFLSGTVVQPQVAGAFSTPSFGCDLVLLDDEGNPGAHEGELALVPPLLGSSSRLLNRDHHAVYYEGMPTTADGRPLRRHGDQMRRLPGGYYRALGRVDDTMNLGGIKVSSGEIERCLAGTAGVAECAAVAVSPPDAGAGAGGPSQLVVFAVLAAGAPDLDALHGVMKKRIATDLNPLFKLHRVVPVDKLPRTASGKVMRRILRRDYEAKPR
ncbi:MAG: AMP-binding protein [Myxococcota bacterium]